MQTYEDPRESRSPGVSGWLVAILLVLVGVLLFRLVLDAITGTKPIQARGDLAEDEKSTIELYKQASPSVVHITTLNLQQNALRLNVTEIPRGTGTGFVWDTKGHIVTNYHVIEGAQVLQVSLGGDSVYQAEVVGSARHHDLAVLKIDAPSRRLKPIPRGRSDNLQVGQKVFAIGNPFGLDRTLTTGVISGLGRQIVSATKRPIYDVIQTDAAINPGNSGGPLLDSAGLLIGVNTAIYSRSGTYAGIGFAIPSEVVNRVVPEIIKHGNLQRPGLGVSIFADTHVEQLVADKVLPRKGVLILDVLEDSAAAGAGLRGTSRKSDGKIEWGDLLISINGRKLQTRNDLFAALDREEVGSELTVEFLRQGTKQRVQLKLKPLPGGQP